MRNKIKQIMKKDEGFTLVELLAVIVILGIIVAIAVPSIGGIINRAETKAGEAEKELVLDAARLYVTENGYDKVPSDGLTVEKLISDGFLEDITDSEGKAKEDSSLALEDKVTVEKNEADGTTKNLKYKFVSSSTGG